MKKKPKWVMAVGIVVLLALTVTAVVAYRVFRAGRLGWDFVENIRYQLATGEDVAETPAGEALAVGYLENIFGDNQELLGKLKGVVQRGLEDDEALKLGEVSSMLVTYRRSDDGVVSDVVAHVLGGFPLGARKPGFHRDGYFRHLIDRDTWTLSNAIISLLGRDMIMFAEEQTAEAHQQILESLLTYGNVMPLVERLRERMYFTAVFPDPKRLLPLQLRHHIQAVIIKGYLSPKEGQVEVVLLTPSSRSASYALSVLGDMRTLAEIALKTKWHGVEETTPWGAVWVDTWWAHEMVRTSDNMVFEKQHNILRAKSTFDRVMVNAVVKSIERLSRDLAQSRASLDERLDPRLVDQRLDSVSPQHYWSSDHRWGPQWPFAGEMRRTNTTAATQAQATPAEALPVTATP